MMKIRHIAFTVVALLITAAAAKGYVLFGPKWAVGQVPYYINPANGDGLSEAAVIADIQAAASAWTNQSNAAISMYYMGKTSGTTASNNGRNEVFFRNASKDAAAATAYWWSDSSNRLIDADIVVWDATYRFYTGSSGCSSGVFVQDIFTHEFGHALGIAHSSVSSATMYPVIKYCSTAFRSLDSDDLAGIEKLYPAAGTTNTAAAVTIASPTGGASFADTAAITFSGSATDKEDGNITSKMVWRSSISGQIGTGGSFSRTLPAGSHTITATVTDSRGVSSSRQVAIAVKSSTTSPTPTPTPAISLSAREYKVKGQHRVDLRWSGATTSSVYVFRDGSRIMTTPNDGNATDSMSNKGGRTYTYRLCEVGTSACSPTISVVF